MAQRRRKPAWDSTVQDLGAHRLSNAELVCAISDSKFATVTLTCWLQARRKTLYESKNAINAQQLIEEQRLRRQQPLPTRESPNNSSFERGRDKVDGFEIGLLTSSRCLWLARRHRKQSPRVIEAQLPRAQAMVGNDHLPCVYSPHLGTAICII
jgi:hypothetical protein